MNLKIPWLVLGFAVGVLAVIYAIRLDMPMFTALTALSVAANAQSRIGD